MLTEEQVNALREEIETRRQDNAILISRVASLEQSLYRLRKKVFGRMSEKNLPLDPQPASSVLKGRDVLHGNVPDGGGSTQKR